MPPDASGGPPARRDARPDPGDRAFVRRVLIVAVVASLAAAAWIAAPVLLLLFGAVVFAIILRGLARLVRRVAPLPRPAAITVVVAGLALVVGGFLALAGSQVLQQFGAIAAALPQTAADLERAIRGTAVGRQALEALGGGQALGDGMTQQIGTVVGWIGGAATALVSGLGYLVVVLIGAVYLAYEPGVYRRGLELMVPEDRVAPLDEALGRAGEDLWKWAAGVLVAMAAIGTVTGLGLWALGVPSPLALGLIAGLLEFVPIIGPIAAGVPAVMLAFTVSPELAAWTFLFFLVVQQIEGNVLLPLIQRRAVSLPPLVSLFAILVAGALFGILGVLFATPLAVALIAVTRSLYVEEALGRDPDRPEGRAGGSRDASAR